MRTLNTVLASDKKNASNFHLSVTGAKKTYSSSRVQRGDKSLLAVNQRVSLLFEKEGDKNICFENEDTSQVKEGKK